MQWRQDKAPPDRLVPYITLLSAFVEQGMPGAEFERRYYQLEATMDLAWTEEEFAVLDQLFGDVDAYVPDPSLAEPDKGDLDEAEIRRRAARALDQLRRLDAKIRR
jgi:hypothetical protein